MQLRKRVKIVIGVPTFGKVSYLFVLARNHLGMPLVTNFIDKFVVGKQIDQARNEIVNFALQQNADYVFFLDDDVLPPPNALLRLWTHQKDVINGVYWSKSPNPVPLIFRGHMNSPYLDWHVGELIKIDAAGCGCTLIHTKVFKKIEPPWFSLNYSILTPKEIQERDYPDIGTTEDLYFYRKVKDAGFEVWCDTAIQCGHVDINTGKIYGMPENAPQAIPGSRIPKIGKKRIANLGSGHQSPFFAEGRAITFDVREECKPDVRCDLRQIPERDQSFDIVFSSHTLEHFGLYEVPRILMEWLRILKVGGELRLIVPNLAYPAQRAIQDKLTEHDMWVYYGQQSYPENFHKSGFTPKLLENLLKNTKCLKNIKVELDKSGANIFATAIKYKHKGIETIHPEFNLDGTPLSEKAQSNEAKGVSIQ